MGKEEGISLETLGDGAAIERFNLELQNVLNNIQDPNTDPKKERSVTLTMKFKPTEQRDMGDIGVNVVAKLAPVKPFGVRVFMGVDAQGNGVATEYNSQQAGLFDGAPKEAEGAKPYILKGREAVQL